jgi:hypothetical protein
MTTRRLDLTRQQILAFRRRVGGLDERQPISADALRHTAWAGLTDSMPRAALLSIHARVAGTQPSTWEDPSLVQLWGPRFSSYVVAEHDRGVFSLGRLSDNAERRRFAQDLATRLEALLDGRRMGDGEAGRALGIKPTMLRYAGPTGRVLIRWDGARQPTIWTVPAPAIDPMDARLELARRYLHVFGVGTPAGFSDWAGIKPAGARTAFEALGDALAPVRTPIGDAWILDEDEPTFRTAAQPAARARLLPSGDTWYLLQGADRELLISDPERRAELWTSRVWPGAVVVHGEVVGTWRRAQALVTITPWRTLTQGEVEAVEAEAATLPLPGLEGAVRVLWTLA